MITDRRAGRRERERRRRRERGVERPGALDASPRSRWRGVEAHRAGPSPGAKQRRSDQSTAAQGSPHRANGCVRHWEKEVDRAKVEITRRQRGDVAWLGLEVRPWQTNRWAREKKRRKEVAAHPLAIARSASQTCVLAPASKCALTGWVEARRGTGLACGVRTSRS